MKHIQAMLRDSQDTCHIAIVSSQFNQSITQALKEGALQRLEECDFPKTHITLVEVPGAVEIPLAVKLLAKQRKYAAIVALGAVIRGETSHYECVCEQVSQGCQQVMLEEELPVIFGVLTTENEAQAWDRLGGHHGHKGKDAIDAALAMISLIKQLS